MTRQGQCKIERSNKHCKTAHIFWWMLEFVSVELFKVKKYSKTRKVFEFFRLTVKPKVLENWKRSWKVMEFQELKRVQTLPVHPM